MKALRRMSVLAKAACHGEEMRVQTSVIPSLHSIPPECGDMCAPPNASGFQKALRSHSAGRTPGSPCSDGCRELGDGAD